MGFTSRFLVYKPMGKILAERRARTEGAIEKARADVATAEARTAEYEQKLREARSALFKAQEARRARSAQARAEALAEARKRAQVQIEQARMAIETDKKVAMSSLEAEAGRLAEEIIRTSVFEPALSSAPRRRQVADEDPFHCVRRGSNSGAVGCGGTCVVVEHVRADSGITFVVRAPGQSVGRECIWKWR